MIAPGVSMCGLCHSLPACDGETIKVTESNWSFAAGLIIRDKSFFKEVRAFTSASDYPVKMSKVDV